MWLPCRSSLTFTGLFWRCLIWYPAGQWNTDYTVTNCSQISGVSSPRATSISLGATRPFTNRNGGAAWAAGVGGTALSLVVSHRVRKGRGAPSRWRHTRRGSTGSLASRRWRGVRSTRAMTWGKTGQYPGFVSSNVEDVRTLNSEDMKPTVSEGSHLECIRFPQILQGGGGLWAPLGVRVALRAAIPEPVRLSESA